jgi:spore germination protein GerM
LLGAYQLGDTLVLDFSRELQTNHSGGSAGELLTVYSIVNTLAENIHGISRVQILVEGNEVETLAGHLDLREPLSPNTTWMTDMSSEQPKV